jgi:hypothetical protein
MTSAVPLLRRPTIGNADVGIAKVVKTRPTRVAVFITTEAAAAL